MLHLKGDLMAEDKLEVLKKDLQEHSKIITEMFNSLSEKYEGVSFSFELDTMILVNDRKKYDFKITANL